MRNKIIEIIKAATENNVDPVDAIRDYFWEKDSRITISEAKRLYESLKAEATN